MSRYNFLRVAHGFPHQLTPNGVWVVRTMETTFLIQDCSFLRSKWVSGRTDKELIVVRHLFFRPNHLNKVRITEKPSRSTLVCTESNFRNFLSYPNRVGCRNNNVFEKHYYNHSYTQMGMAARIFLSSFLEDIQMSIPAAKTEKNLQKVPEEKLMSSF